MHVLHMTHHCTVVHTVTGTGTGIVMDTILKLVAVALAVHVTACMCPVVYYLAKKSRLDVESKGSVDEE
jgi:hypothetical protein